MISNVPPQRALVSMLIRNTRLVRRVEFIATWGGAGGFPGSEDRTVIPRQVHRPRRHQAASRAVGSRCSSTRCVVQSL